MVHCMPQVPLSVGEVSHNVRQHDQGGQRGQGHGVVLHVQGEGYQPPITFSQVPKGPRMTPPTHPG